MIPSEQEIEAAAHIIAQALYAEFQEANDLSGKPEDLDTLPSDTRALFMNPAREIARNVLEAAKKARASP